MATYSEEILAAMRVVGAAAWQADMEKSAAATASVGTASEEASAKTAIAGKRFGSSATHFLKYAAAAGIAYKAASFLKNAVSNTAQLAIASSRLETITGFDVKTASSWISVAKERHINSQLLIRSFGQLGRAQSSAAEGSKSQLAVFAKLGISAQDLKQRNPAQLLGRIADGFSKLPNPADKANTAMKVFGRSGLQLIPLLKGGSAAMNEQLQHVQKLGGSLTKDGQQRALHFAAQMRTLNAAMTGVSVQIGLALMPAIVDLSTAIVGLLRFLNPLFKLMGRYPAVLYAVTGGVIALYVANKILTAYQRENIIVTKLAAAAQWLWNIAMESNPIGIVIVALAALGVAFYEAYKHVAVFRRGVQIIWGWIKKNWPLLAGILFGPFGIAVALIVKNLDKIKRAVRSVVSAVRHPLGTLEHLGHSLISHIPGLQEGGRVTQSGVALVGERGPEVVRLPTAAQVIPLSGGAGQVVVPVYLDGREIARAMGQFNADRRARR